MPRREFAFTKAKLEVRQLPPGVSQLAFQLPPRLDLMVQPQPQPSNLPQFR